MPRANPTFDLDSQPEVFGSTVETSTAIHRAVADGRARRIARSLYTRNIDEPLEQVVRRNWPAVASHYVPGGVLVDRSAIEARPSQDGSLFLDAGPDHSHNRTYRVGGLWIKPRRGPGPLPGDMPHLNGLHFSSRARALLDNMHPSRSRQGVARTLSRAEMEDHLAGIAARRGHDDLSGLRDDARELAEIVDDQETFAALDDLLGTMQGTRDGDLVTPGARAAARGEGYDRERIELFGTLQSALLRAALPVRPEQPGPWVNLAFIEAYFSNWIEGTEFELEEAEEIVFQRVVPQGRFEEAHDVLGTFDLVNDPARRGQLPGDAPEFVELLRSHHAAILERRPSALPGQFKERINRAGGTTFVHPDLVLGTLSEGFRYLEAVPEGLARAIFFQFLISEVHPFADGNGRMARIMMNAELTARAEHRVLVPLVYRDNYLQGLRALSRGNDPEPLIGIIEYAQEYAGQIDWSQLADAERTLRATNAFVEPDQADGQGARLILPAVLGADNER